MVTTQVPSEKRSDKAAERRLPRVLVAGSRATFSPVFERLQESGRYNFDYVALRELSPAFSHWRPSVVLLQMPEEKEAAEHALSSLKALKDEVPVVVMSTAADMNLYLAAMTYGAFDYFTSYTPLDEISRMLDKAVYTGQKRAA
jgi:DNA-binding NtrC family response regulator